MDSDRWSRTEHLFHAALALPSGERPSFLDEACPEPDLRDDVLALLAAHDSDGPLSGRLPVTAFLEGLTVPLPSGVAPARPTDLTGTRVGPHRLIREVGRGGMGTVYLADRADGAFRQHVALKLVRTDLPGSVGGSARARFLRERDVLAGLEHPGIARLLGGGETEGGDPYVTMEYVEGEPITAFADRHRLTVADRIDLFLQVCEAVAYAHRRLVVHRDLKPSNVFVAEGEQGPQVKLLDFGIASLLDGDGEQTVFLGTGRAFTPEYAAPEQVAGEAVGTAADVWALGVLLHRLLAGRRPFPSGTARAPSSDPHAEPPSVSATRPGGDDEPSAEAVADARQTTPDRLRRTLTGDLDAIVARCLRPEPDARYASVDALADDLGRHRTGRPVQARRGGRRYVAGRFLRRNRWGVATALIGATLLVGFTSALVVKNRETERARARAEATVSFLRDVLSGANALETGRGDVTVAEMLDDAASRLPAAFASQPDVQASLLFTIGDAYAGLSRYQEAAPLLQRALALQRTVAPGDHPDTASLLGTLGLIVAEEGGLDSAAALQREALDMTRRLYGPRSIRAAHVMNNLAWVRLQQNRHAETERLLLGAISMLGGARPDSAAVVDAARARSTLAILKMRTGEYEDAERLEAAALALRERVLPPGHPLIALSLSNLAKVLEDSGRSLDRALPYAERALSIRREISGDSSVAVLTSRSNLAAIYRGLGRHADAVHQARTATRTAEALFGEEHTATAYARYNLALALHAAGQRDAASREYRKALESHVAIWGMDHPYTAYVLVPFAKLLLEEGDVPRAERMLRPAVRARRGSLAPGNWLTADAEATLARALYVRGRKQEALPLLKRAVPALLEQRGQEACATRQAVATQSAARASRSLQSVPRCV